MQAISGATTSIYHLLSGLWPPAPKFTEKDLPSLLGRVYLVTGGTSGIGFELCRILYSKSATVYLTGRESAKADTAMSLIRSAHADSKGVLVFIQLDFGDLSGIKASAERLLSQTERLDVVWHSAGIIHNKGNKTKQGYELQLGVNAIAPWLFQHFLTPLLERTVKIPGTVKGSVRVVWVSSSGHSTAPPDGGILWDDINFRQTYIGTGMQARLTYNGAWIKYGQSKAASIIIGAEAAKRWAGNGVISLSVHPGLIKTPLQDDNPAWIKACLMPMMHALYWGVVTYLFAGLSPQIDQEGYNGAYIVPWGKIGKPREDVEKMLPENGKRLWEWYEEECREFM